MEEKTKFLIQYFIIYFFKNFLFLKIYLVLILTKNLTATQVSLILSVYSIASILIEIPVGALSDFVGCKKLIIYSILILIVGYIVILFDKSFFGFCVFYCCFGLYDTIFSASKEALIYNNIKYLNLKNDFPKYKNITRIIAFSSLSVAAFISGKLITDNLDLVLKIDITSLIIYSLVIAWTNEHQTISLKKLNNDYRKSLKNGFKYIWKHKTLIKFVIFESIWYPILMIIISFCPVFYKEMNVTKNINIMVSCQVITIAIMQLCFISKLYKQKIYLYTVMFFLGAICEIISLYLYNNIFSYILNILYLFFTQVADILLYVTVQDLIPSKSRSCIASIRNFLDSTFRMIFLYVLGFLFKVYDYRIGFISLFVFYVVCCTIFVYSICMDKHLIKKSERRNIYKTK